MNNIYISPYTPIPYNLPNLALGGGGGGGGVYLNSEHSESRKSALLYNKYKPLPWVAFMDE